MERYKEIDKACEACGLKGVWICSLPTCPQKDAQNSARQSREDSANEGSEDK